MRFKVQIFVSGGSCPIFSHPHQVFPITLSFDSVIQIELLQFRTSLDPFKFCNANAADNLSIFTNCDKINALLWIAVIIIAQMI